MPRTDLKKYVKRVTLDVAERMDADARRIGMSRVRYVTEAVNALLAENERKKEV